MGVVSPYLDSVIEFSSSYNQVLDILFDDGTITEPVTLAEAKNFCKIDDITDDDALITELITAAREECEGITCIGFIERGVTAIMDNNNGGGYLPYGPIGTVTFIDGVAPTTDQIMGEQWKQLMVTGSRIKVEYTGGYTTLPYKLKLAMLQCIFYLYDERKRREDAFPPTYLETLKGYSRK